MFENPGDSHAGTPKPSPGGKVDSKLPIPWRFGRQMRNAGGNLPNLHWLPDLQNGASRRRPLQWDPRGRGWFMMGDTTGG